MSNLSSKFLQQFIKYICSLDCCQNFARLPVCRFSRVEKLASHRCPRAPSSCRTSPRDLDWSMSPRCVSRGKILRDTTITDEPTHTVCDSDKQHRDGTGRDGMGRDRTGQDRLLLGIRTVNPGFYSPGIEVYSVLSRPRYVCAVPLRVHVPELCPTIVRQDVCISPLLDMVLAGKGKERWKASPSFLSLSLFTAPVRCHLLSVESSSISRLGPSSSASLSTKRDLREKRAIYPDLLSGQPHRPSLPFPTDLLRPVEY